jgi:hypothetical protein
MELEQGNDDRTFSSQTCRLAFRQFLCGIAYEQDKLCVFQWTTPAQID